MVVAIVVLLILAGVSISLVLDNNGIINRSKEARNKYGEAKDNEQKQLNGVSDWIDKQVGGNGGGSTILPDETDETKPYLPSGFTKDENTNLDNGLVIRDGASNEYVWVEVPKSIYNNANYNTETNTGDKKPANKEDAEKIEYCLKKYASAYREDGFADRYVDEYIEDSTPGWFAGKTAYDNAKKTMLASVYENGGFYVGRYEAGISEFRTSNENTPTEVPSSKQNMFPYTNITRAQAKQLAEKVNAGGRTSSLMFGIQWDLMLVFIQNKGGVDVATLTTDSTNIGNYYNNKWSISNNKAKYNADGTWNNGSYTKETESEVLLTTGASSSFAKMNIYDVAGNVFEWTLEGNPKYSSTASSRGIKLASLVNTQISPIKMAATAVLPPCVYRGGGYEFGTDYPVSSRNGSAVDFCVDDIGFRVTLY